MKRFIFDHWVALLSIAISISAIAISMLCLVGR